MQAIKEYGVHYLALSNLILDYITFTAVEFQVEADITLEYKLKMPKDGAFSLMLDQSWQPRFQDRFKFLLLLKIQIKP